MNTELYYLIENISPAALAKFRRKRQDTSTRDKEILLKKVAEIEEILNQLNIQISLKKI
nr:hypothetical protein [uncultured Pedobacter sp.]